MAEMAAAAAAMNFGSRHKKAAVGLGFDGLFERCPKAWPAGATVELGVRREKRLTATGPKGMGELFKVLAVADPKFGDLPGFEA